MAEPETCSNCSKPARYALHSPTLFECGHCGEEWGCENFNLCGASCDGLYWDVSFRGKNKAEVGGMDECGGCGRKICFDTTFKVTALAGKKRDRPQGQGQDDKDDEDGGDYGGRPPLRIPQPKKKHKKNKQQPQQQQPQQQQQQPPPPPPPPNALATRIAEAVAKVAQTGAPEPLPPMPSWQRYKAHMAAEAAGLQSRSEGEGDARFVVLLPAP